MCVYISSAHHINVCIHACMDIKPLRRLVCVRVCVCVCVCVCDTWALDWLVDRRHCEARWLVDGRAVAKRVRQALEQLPPNDTLTPFIRRKG